MALSVITRVDRGDAVGGDVRWRCGTAWFKRDALRYAYNRWALFTPAPVSDT
jgi:hypothetical protein